MNTLMLLMALTTPVNINAEEIESAEEVFDTFQELNMEEPEAPEERPHLTRSGGIFDGPSGKETYYNLNMGGCIRIMRDKGYSLDDYPYWVRSDGAKMFGDYVMIAVDTSVYPKGTIIETSLGQGIVVDHCVAATWGNVAVDIAVNW